MNCDAKFAGRLTDIYEKEFIRDYVSSGNIPYHKVLGNVAWRKNNNIPKKYQARKLCSFIVRVKEFPLVHHLNAIPVNICMELKSE